MTVARIFFVLAMVGMLTACGDEKKTGAERKSAAGEVLGGTITDDMLPLDTVRSQSPPLRGVEGEDGEDTGDLSRPIRPNAASREAPPTAAAATAEPAAQPSPTETSQEAPE